MRGRLAARSRRARACAGVQDLSGLIVSREGNHSDNARSFLSQTMGRTDHYLELLHNDTLGSLLKYLPQPPQFNAPVVRLTLRRGARAGAARRC
jgi:hypothetical protein